MPIEHAPAVGRDLEFILCIWVHGHAQGRGSFQGRGMGSALLAALEQDARARGVKGLAAWGLALPFWMRASWFKRHGYRKADRRGLSVLLWKRFDAAAEPPRWLAATGKRPEPVPGKVVVTGCLSGWCPAQNLAFERARRAASKLGPGVEVREVPICDRATLEEWGESDALFVDGAPVRTGPPPSEAKLDALLRRRLRRLPAPAR